VHAQIDIATWQRRLDEVEHVSEQRRVQLCEAAQRVHALETQLQRESERTQKQFSLFNQFTSAFACHKQSGFFYTL
jgi:hypothetical protein